MARLQLNLGCGSYDQTRALMDGSVQPEGIDLKYTLSFPADTFPRMVRDKAFDVSELGFTYYLGTLAQPNPPFVAIPVYPIRFFPQSAIFVNSDSGIKEPKDLIGRRLAELFIYGHDAGTWAKGMLSDEYGVPVRGVSYKVGGLDRPASRWDWLPFDTPPDVQVQQIGPDQTLDALLESGEIDALYSAMVPPSLVKGSRRVRYLFQNHEAAGRDYFRRTGIFPIMHVVVIRKEIYQEDPWVAESLYKAFVESKRRAEELYRFQAQHMQRIFMIPWLSAHVEENRALMGDDPWPYGLKKNRKPLETFLRYHYEHGLSSRHWKPEDLFTTETIDT